LQDGLTGEGAFENRLAQALATAFGQDAGEALIRRFIMPYLINRDVRRESFAPAKRDLPQEFTVGFVHAAR